MITKSYRRASASGEAPDFSEFPSIVKASSSRPEPEYRRVDTHFAAHQVQSASAPAPLIDFGTEKIAVYPIHLFSEVAPRATALSPVYALKKGGTLAVPTGRVFVRFANRLKLADQVERLREVGYEIEQVVPYAPSSGWVHSTSIESSLTALPKLAAISGAENVEPQMLMKATRKA
jgi:hypothetical protein